MLTERQQKLLDAIRKLYDWQLLGSWNKAFRDDLHVLWIEDLIILSDDHKYVRPKIKSTDS